MEITTTTTDWPLSPRIKDVGRFRATATFPPVYSLAQSANEKDTGASAARKGLFVDARRLS